MPDGDLYNHVFNDHPYGLPVDKVRRYALCIINALQVLEAANIIHADLKIENILRDSVTDTVKISDFGISREDVVVGTYDTVVQCICMRAPEVCNITSVRNFAFLETFHDHAIMLLGCQGMLKCSNSKIPS